MINCNKHIFTKIEKDLDQLLNQNAISLRTYKNDRGFLIQKNKQNSFKLIEEGFFNKQEDNLTKNEVLKKIQKCFIREFPRSHKIKYKIIEITQKR